MDTVLHKICQWSTTRPKWQRDALRRLLSQTELGDDDVDQLTLICKVEHGHQVPEGDTPDAVPLTVEHLPSGRNGDEATRLLELRAITGVNALAPDQSLAFEPEGLTIVYGDNGSGKSGYARVLRTLCRARGDSLRIHPNIFASKGTNQSAEAVIRCSQTEKVVQWTPDQPAPEAMSRILFFDSHSTISHVDDRNDVAFMPFGLDLFDKLVKLCERIGSRLDRDQGQLLAATADLSMLEGDHEVGRLIAALTADSKPEAIERLATWTAEDQQNLKTLEKRIAELQAADPAGQARTLRAKASRYQQAAEQLKTTASMFTATALSAVRTAAVRAKTTKAASDAAAKALRAEDLLPGTGDSEWRHLWEAARRFSENHGYPDQSFPVTTAQSQCVLCQQKLDEATQQRLSRFEQFVQDDVQKQAAEAATEFQRLLEPIKTFSWDTVLERPFTDELKADDAPLATAVDAFLKSASTTRDSVLQLATNSDVVIPATLPSPHDRLLQQAADLTSRAIVLEGDKRLEQLQADIKEREAMVARQRLAQHKPRVLGQIQRLQSLATLEKCKESLKTNAISRKSTELTQEFVTEALCKRFDRELRRLDPRGLQVELKAVGSSRGITYHQVKLKSDQKVRVSEVLSEGEFRCVALAGLLTELATASHRSTLIFDDPVSSLDHRWRDRVALRLVEEAKARQVIVFTHDLVFFLMLKDHAETMKVAAKDQHLIRGAAVIGLCQEGPPWYGMKVNKRLGLLKQKLQEAKKVARTQSEGAYASHAREIYGLLRETWERAVEEVLLNGSVMRFQREIKTQSLADVLHDVSEADYDVIERGMTRCSTFLPGHDQAAAINEPVPPPEELEADIVALDEWVRGVRKRRQTLGQKVAGA
ncbi:MAG: AAA family ATPase [Phycisphaeraceae bacterium]